VLNPQVSSTFHGRDIFSPAAAHLAEGWDFTMAGAVVPQLVQLTPKVSNTSENGIEGDIIGLDDPYGSLITDIPGEEFKKLGYQLGDKIIVQLNKKPFTVPYEKTFMDVQVGEPLLYIDSRGRLGLALNQRNFSQVNKTAPPGTIFIPRKGAAIKK
jgi:S-adenosylmethionine hydrolase